MAYKSSNSKPFFRNCVYLLLLAKAYFSDITSQIVTIEGLDRGRVGREL